MPFVCASHGCLGMPRDEATALCAACAAHKAYRATAAPVQDIERPAHYGGDDNPHEPIKVIEHYALGFHVGNAVKYILRAGRKDGEDYLKDLIKARWYLDREISRLQKKGDAP
jgi:hypothetical protein